MRCKVPARQVAVRQAGWQRFRVSLNWAARARATTQSLNCVSGMRASAGIVAGVTVVVVLLSWCQSAPAAEFRDPGPVRALPGPGDDTLLGDVFAYQYVIAVTYGIALVVAVVLLALQEFLLRCRLNSHPDGQSDAVFRSVIPDETRTRRRT